MDTLLINKVRVWGRRSLAFCLLAFLPLAAMAQTLNVTVGNVTYQFPATQTGDMNYANGTTLTIMGKEFALADIIGMVVDNAAVKDNLVTVAYEGTTARVTVAGNVAQYVTPVVDGAHVSIAQSNTGAVDDDEITYQLTGSSTDGSLTLAGSYKCTVSLAGVTLTNPNGAAINITNKKRIQISAKKSTENVLTDGTGGSQKGCLYSKGQIQLQGNGALTVYGNTSHAIKSGDYITVKNLTLNIPKAVKDGISCNKYFQMKSGSVTIGGVGDDGIQCDLESDDDATGETTDHEDENSGNVYVEGGTLTISATAVAAKGVKAEGDIKISGGTITASTTGDGEWEADATLSTGGKTKAAACLSADGNIAVSGGTLSLTSTGHGGKGISGDGTFTVTGGSITVTTSGDMVVYNNGTLYNGNFSGDDRVLDNLNSNYKSSAKGIKIDGNVNISGGIVNVTTTGKGAEGIESKAVLTISDNANITVNAYDDGINSSSDLYIKGGYVFAKATNNDGIDANGNCYIQGGLVYAIGSGGAEKSIDANTEGGKKLYITGGTIIAVGDLENGSSISGVTCKQTTSWGKDTWHGLYSDGTLVAAFKTPTASSSQGGGPGGGGPGGGGPGGGGNQKLIVATASTPTLKAGVTVIDGTEYFNGMANIGATVTGGTSVNLSNYSSSGGWW